MYICKYCGKEFENSFVMRGHIPHCKKNPKYEENKIKCNNFKQYNNKIKKPSLTGQKKKCQYCGKECGIYGLKNHEKYCEQNTNRVKYPIEKHLKDSKCHTAWNKGLTAETDERIKNGIITLKKYYETHDGSWKGRKHTDEEKNKISKSIREAIKNNPESYSSSNVNGRVKRINYNENITLDSSWEFIVAKYLDTNNIKWERPQTGIQYFWENGYHTYFPDFYLPEYNIFIEVKGYERERDKAKYKSLNNLILIKQKDVKMIEENKYDIFKIINGKLTQFV